METLLHDLRYGVRMLLKSPVYTAVTIIVLALGIGANTAIFSVVNGVLLRPLPYKYPDRIVSVLTIDHGKESNSHTPANYVDLKNQSQSFEYLSSYCDFAVSLIGAGEPRSFDGGIVSSEFFDLLGVDPVIGRTFHSGDNKAGGTRPAILSYKVWKSEFNGDRNVIGREVTLKNEPFTIIGVMPSGFAFPEKTELWLLAQKEMPDPPFAVENYETQRGFNYFQVMGRLKAEVSVQNAQADVNTIASRLQHDYPDANDQKGLMIKPLQNYLVRDVRDSLLVLLGAVAAVLLIAVANVANLSLARAATRQQEMAIRVALGASRFRIIRQLLTESLLLSCLGGLGGLLLALWGTGVLISISPEDIPRLKDVTVDGKVFAFTVVVSVLAGVLFGISPSIQSSKPNLNEDLKEGSRGSTATGRRFRGTLVVAEVALSIVLLISAGLMIKSFARLQEVNTGFNPANVLVAQINLPGKKYSKSEQIADFIQRLVPKIKALPGVVNAATTTTTPYSGSDIDTSFQIEGRPPASPDEKLDVRYDAVSPDFFSTFGVPLIKGRFFTDRDVAKAPQVTIISQTMAKKFFGDQDPIGKKLVNGFVKDQREIVGIVGDVRYDALNQEPLPQMYDPVAQVSLPFIAIVVRTSVPPMTLSQTLREQVWAVDKDQPVDEMKDMDEYVSKSASQARFRTILLGSFSAIALVLAAVGIFGVIAYTVNQSTREIGIRMALGAQKTDVLKLVISHGMILTVIGIVIGLVGAFFLTQFLATLLYGVGTKDPATFALIPILLAVVSLLATYLPARRAARVDPLVAIRHD